MSGHSKWSTIKRKKGANDAQRAKIFTKIAREITVVVKAGGPDPESNSKLRDVMAKARANNMPNDNIMRTIKKAAGENDGDNYEEITYEGYGPNGVAVIVETLTDNRNRTAGDMRHFFDKFHGNLGQSGCVSFLFDKKGIIIIEPEEKLDEDALMMDALDAGADDFSAEEGYYEVTTAPENFSIVREALEKKYPVSSAEVEMVAQTDVELTDPEDRKNMSRLLEILDDYDDVQNVYHNWSNPDVED